MTFVVGVVAKLRRPPSGGRGGGISLFEHVCDCRGVFLSRDVHVSKGVFLSGDSQEAPKYS